MLAKAKIPSLGRSVSFLERPSLTITREMKEELLLVMLFLGFLFLFTSLLCTCASKALPSPNAGAEPSVMEVAGASLVEPALPSSLLMPPSAE